MLQLRLLLASASALMQPARFHAALKLPLLPSGERLKELILQRANFLLKELCGVVANDGHSECVSCLGKSHSEAAHVTVFRAHRRQIWDGRDFFHVLSRAVEELGLHWSPPEEPTHSCLDEWYLPGRHQASRQHAAMFFLEVHDELSKSWRAPYSPPTIFYLFCSHHCQRL